MTTGLESRGYRYDAGPGVWMRPGYAGIAYSDGEEVETRLAEVIRQASDLSVFSPELRVHCVDWPSLYHLGSARANILRPFEPSLKGKRVLEIGAGCGALTRYLGEIGSHTLALEGSPRRAAIARARTRDLENVEVLAESFEAFENDGGFDVVTLIGVVEYASQFMAGDDPYHAMLERARVLLKPEGLLIVAIENRFGLKYFAGAPEDHLGQPMAGIEERYGRNGPRTFGRGDWQRLLKAAGFETLEFLIPFPDYKLPVSILSSAGMKSSDFDAAALAWQSVRRDPQLPVHCCFSAELVWPGLLANGLGPDLANSFLIAASVSSSSPPDAGCLGWHYSTDRIAPYCREAVFTRTSGNSIAVNYRRLGLSASAGVSGGKTGPLISYHCPPDTPYEHGRPLALDFIRLATSDGWSLDRAGIWMREYLAILSRLAGQNGGSAALLQPGATLPGDFLDATPQNIVIRPDGRPVLFDLEWRLQAPLEAGFLVFRSLLRFAASITRFGKPADNAPMTWKTFFTGLMEATGLRLRDEDFRRYRRLEMDIQEHITGIKAQDFLEQWEARELPITSLHQALLDREQRIRELNADLWERNHRIKDLEDHTKALDKHARYLSDLLTGALIRIENMSASFSWRVTAPLRKFLELGIRIGQASRPGRWLLKAARTLLAGLSSGRQRLARWRRNTATAIRSKTQSADNLPALQALSNRRVLECARRTATAAAAPSDWPELDISVVSYNSARWIESFFKSLRIQNYPLGRLYLRVVDHDSRDDSVAVWEKLRQLHGADFAGFEIIRQPNRGFGAGHHRAISEGRAEYCLVSNIDLEFSPDCLGLLVRTALNDPDGTVASWEPRQKPFEHPKYYDPVTLETNWSSHACVLFRRGAYQKAGGYDPAIFMYGEDVELSYRFRSHGYALKYVPRAVVMHYAYENPGEIKPLQYAGSLAGNLKVRLRYGGPFDRMAGFAILSSRLWKPGPFRGVRRLLFRTTFKSLFKTCFHRCRKGAAPALYPLCDEDYEITRDGAYYAVRSRTVKTGAPLVSILTRTYKGREKLLEQAVWSVLQQTYPAIELLIIEDGGDSLASRVASFSGQARDGIELRHLAQPKNGRSAAGNAGLAAARGAYIMFLDDDDLLFADHVETLAAALESQPDAVAAYGHVLEVATDYNVSALGYSEQAFELPDVFRQEWDYDLLNQCNFIAIQSLLFKRELYQTRGGFDTNLDLLEDWNLWLRYGHGNRFVYVPKTTSLFRIPANAVKQFRRHMSLHAAYAAARDSALSHIGNQSEGTDGKPRIADC